MAEWGLVEGSILKEQIVRIDRDRAVRYKVVVERIDLTALRRQRRELQEQLAMPEPGDAELVEMGRFGHPYYIKDDAVIQMAIDQIDELLGD